MASYSIRNTRGQIIANVADTTLDTTTSVYLVGRNYSGYGIYLNDNSVRLMENFAGNTAPVNPLEGQIWYDTSVDRLKWWEGSTWKQLQSTEVSLFNPTSVGRRDGDMWYDTNNEQLFIWNASPSGNVSQARWDLVGPAYSSTIPKTGVFVETIFDTGLVAHHVVSTYSNGRIVSILSNDAEFTPDNSNLVAGFPTIKRGLQLTANVGPYTFAGTATNATQLAGVDSSFYVRRDLGATFANTAPIAITSNLGLTIGELSTANLRVNYADGDLIITNNKSGGNVQILTKSSPGNAVITAVNINSDGYLTLVDDPTANLHAVTKRYVDIRISSANQNILSNAALLNSYITAANASIAALESNAASQQSQINLRATIADPGFTGVPTAPTAAAGTNTTQLATTEFVFEANTGLAARVFANTAAIANNLVTNYAPLVNPALTGVPTAPTAAAGTNTTQLATTAFVKTSIDNLDSNVSAAIALRAPIANPALTGVPTAPTAPISANTTQLATTEFVSTKIDSLFALTSANTGSIVQSLDAYALKASPTFTGVPAAPTAAEGTNTTQIATTAFVGTAINTLNSSVSGALALRAPLASPALSGTPTAPTASSGTNTTQVATTAFVKSAGDAITAAYQAADSSLSAAIALRAPIASPAFTGTPMAPTAPGGTSTTQIATTAFVASAINAFNSGLDFSPYAPKASPALSGTPTAPTATVATDTTQLATTAFVHDVIPRGVILMWSGSVASIPSGWALCNGTNSTPDLRDRFIIGAGSTYSPTNTGGSASASITINAAGSHDHGGATASHTLTVDQIPSHSHSLPAAVQQVADGNVVNSHKNANPVGQVTATNPTGGGQGHSHNISSDGSHTHSVLGSWLPPYYALAFIMKITG